MIEAPTPIADNPIKGSYEQGPRLKSIGALSGTPPGEQGSPAKQVGRCRAQRKEPPMFADQYEEHLADSSPCASRWDGFDRGDVKQDDDDLTLDANQEVLASIDDFNF